MPPDATLTKQRIMDAAFAEFAAFGLAGARVDRIATTARANKRLIYLHFGKKADLFARVAAEALVTVTDAVPFTVGDLPGYAGALFDHLCANPRLLQLAVWSQLQRPEATDPEVNAYRDKIKSLKQAQAAGTVSSVISAAGLLSVILAIVNSWAVASPALKIHAARNPESPRELRRRRAEIVAAVARITTP